VQIEAKAERGYQKDEVKVNTILAIKAGEIIPIDGVVIDGDCEVDEKTLTGGHSLETMAKFKVMAFDKTSTIKRMNLRSQIFNLFRTTLIYWVSCIESKLSHPFAEAIVGTFLSGCFVYKKGPSQLNQWDPGGCALVHWRS